MKGRSALTVFLTAGLFLVKPLVSNVRSRYTQQTVWVRSNYYLQAAYSFRALVYSTNWWEGTATSWFTPMTWYERVATLNGFAYTGKWNTPATVKRE
jgi:hypothetical protein